MSEIWNFSPSLEEQVELCITAVRIEEHNKWLKEFGHVKIAIESCKNIVPETLIDLCDSNEIYQYVDKDRISEVSECMQENIGKLNCELAESKLEDLVEILETELRSNFDFMVKECLENYPLLSLLAQKLSTNTIDKLCTLIYDSKNINKLFLNKFFEYFLATYVKREYNSSTLDILVRSNKSYPSEFRLLLKMLFKDNKIPTKVVQDFVLISKEEDKTKFLEDLAEFDLSGEEFVINLFSIYTAYKDCTKTDRTQRYVQSMLSQYASYCVNDRNYGRLFLLYLQDVKSTKGTADFEQLEKLLEMHKSPFKRPCLMLLKELTKIDDEMSICDDDSD